jgi:hypothetical protein
MRQRLENLRRSANVSVRSTDTGVFVDKIASKQAFLHVAGLAHKPEMPATLSRRIGTVGFQQLEVTTRLPEDSDTQRSVIFFLAGPHNIWPVTAWTELSWTGYVKMDVQNSEIDLGEHCSLAVKVQPRYEFYSPASLSSDPRQIATVYTLEFSDTPESAAWSADDFLTCSIGAADDLTWLMSLVSTQRTTWFAYDFIRERTLGHFVRHVPDCSSHVDPWAFELVSTRANWLGKGYAQLKSLRSRGIDLQLPIVNYVSGNEAKFVEGKFTSYFLALESLKDMYLDSRSETTLVSDREFRPIRGELAALLKTKFGDSAIGDGMIEKLPELNRPSLRASLEAMSSAMGVTWRDLYPNEADFTLVGTRNRLFHTAKKVPFDDLVREKERTRILVERLLLAFLGLSADARPVDPGMHRFLTGR